LQCGFGIAYRDCHLRLFGQVAQNIGELARRQRHTARLERGGVDACGHLDFEVGAGDCHGRVARVDENVAKDLDTGLLVDGAGRRLHAGQQRLAVDSDLHGSLLASVLDTPYCPDHRRNATAVAGVSIGAG